MPTQGPGEMHAIATVAARRWRLCSQRLKILLDRVIVCAYTTALFWDPEACGWEAMSSPQSVIAARKRTATPCRVARALRQPSTVCYPRKVMHVHIGTCK